MKTLRGLAHEELSDYELLCLYTKDSDNSAFETLVHRHRRQVYNFILKMTRNPQASEDIFQDTFVRVIKNAHTYRPKAKFTTWCLQIARNLTLDYFKKENIRRHPSIDASRPSDDFSLKNILENDDPTSSEALLKEEMFEYLHDGIQELPDNQREALTLRIFEDLPYAEISEILGSPEGTVKYWVHEGVAAIGRFLERKGLK